MKEEEREASSTTYCTESEKERVRLFIASICTVRVVDTTTTQRGEQATEYRAERERETWVFPFGEEQQQQHEKSLAFFFSFFFFLRLSSLMLLGVCIS